MMLKGCCKPLEYRVVGQFDSIFEQPDIKIKYDWELKNRVECTAGIIHYCIGMKKWKSSLVRILRSIICRWLHYSSQENNAAKVPAPLDHPLQSLAWDLWISLWQHCSMSDDWRCIRSLVVNSLPFISILVNCILFLEAPGTYLSSHRATGNESN